MFPRLYDDDFFEIAFQCFLAKLLIYRCRDSENRIVNLPLGDDACWQNDSGYVMSAGLKVLYVRYQQAIYAVAVNPYLENDSFHVALKLAHQVMKGQ